MNPVIKRELEKVRAQLPEYDDSTTLIKISRDTTSPSPSLKEGGIYLIELADYVLNEPPNFTLPTFNLNPCKIGRHSCCSFYNTGSASRGIAVAFIGNYVENDEIIFEDTQIRIWKQQGWGKQ